MERGIKRDVRLLAGEYDRRTIDIQLFGRTRDGETITILWKDFDPYFMLVEPSDRVRRGLETERQDGDEIRGFKDIELWVRAMDGKSIEKRNVLRVTMTRPYKVPEYRDRYAEGDNVLAADIPFVYRFMFDKDLSSCVTVSGNLADEDEAARYTTDLVVVANKFADCETFHPDLKILSFDIENSLADDIVQNPQFGMKAGRIFTICCAVRDPKKDGIQYFTITHDQEERILNEFSKLIRDTDPDVITGYNIENYDIPVVMERAAKHGLRCPWGRNGLEPRIRAERYWKVSGRVVADAWWNAKKQLRPKKETLNAIAELVLGEKKEDVDPKHIDAEWAGNREKVVSYCRKDAELALRILEEIRVLRQCMDLATVSKLPLDDVINGRTSTLIDSILIREADRKQIGVPMTRRTSKDSKIEGGYVHKVNPGLYHWVITLDFMSMYPSIIITNNLCYTTLSKDGSIVSPYKNVKFLSPDQRKGLVPDILAKLLKDRGDAKRHLKEAKASKDKDMVNYYDGLQQAIKILMNCFSEDTEVLTPQGFRHVKDMQVGDLVYSIDPATQVLGIEPVIETQEYDYDGPMVHFDTNSVDLLVTPNHRMLVKRKKGSRPVFIEAKDAFRSKRCLYGVRHYNRHLGDKRDTIDLWDLVDGSFVCVVRPNMKWSRRFSGVEGFTKRMTGGYYIDPVMIDPHPEAFEKDNDCSLLIKDFKKGYFKPYTFDTGDFLELLGWFISEGTLQVNERKGRRGGTWAVTIAQDDPKNRKRIVGLLRRMGFRSHENEKAVTFSSKLIGKYLLKNGAGGLSGTKCIPPGVFSLHPRALFRLYEALMMGDGNIKRGKNLRYSTRSIQLAKDMVHLCFLLGIGASYHLERPGDIYRVQLRPRNFGGSIRPDEGKALIDGVKRKVYCVTVGKNHTVFAGRNGRFGWCGQSFYGVFASAFYRFTDNDIGASITAYARRNITDIITKLQDEGYDVIYSDTDSVFVLSPEQNKEATVALGKEMARKFTKGDAVLEFEKVMEPFFTHGAKKRYFGKVVWPTEEMLVRGYETRRTDAFDFQSESLTEIFEHILNADIDGAIELARERVEKVQKGDVEVSKLVISRTAQEPENYKNPDRMANVQAARKLMDLGYEFVPGMKVSWIVTDGKGTPQQVEPFVDGRRFEHVPDWEYYAKRVAGSLARVTEVFNWDEKALLSGTRQVDLFSDFGPRDHGNGPRGGHSGRPRSGKGRKQKVPEKGNMELSDFM